MMPTTTTILPVSEILNILNDSSNSSFYIDQNMDSPVPRAKKRRLDNLTWEEKIQRKKLKNRVAAQTSRDRKKAKQEQMEIAIQQLFTKNESLIEECEKLRKANERLRAENEEFNKKIQMSVPKPVCRVHARKWISKIHTSAERIGRGHSSGSGEQHPTEDPAHLLSLPDLLDELEAEYINVDDLEQFTQSLLQDIAKELESAAQKAADQESTISGQNQEDSREVVGTTSEQLESCGRQVLKKDCSSIERDISEYLLLHHNYAKSPKEATKSQHQNARKFKSIRPKTTSVTIKPVLQQNNPSVQPFNDRAVIITSIPSNEIVLEDDSFSNLIQDSDITMNQTSINVPNNNLLTVPKKSLDICLSPKSDLGYESSTDLETCWESNVSELFPSLF